MNASVQMNQRDGRRLWAIVAGTELLYLLYFYVPFSTPHSAALFSWLPFGQWKITGPLRAPLFYAACVGSLFFLYMMLLRNLTGRAERRQDARVVFVGAALFSVTLLLMPSLMSKDLFDYMGHGRVLSVYHANPFTRAASEFGADQFTQAMGWPDATPLYGPAWGSLCALLTLIGRGNFLTTALLFKFFLAAVHMVNGTLIYLIAQAWKKDAVRPVRAAAFYLWNPLVITQTAGDAHNDAFTLMWLLLAFWFVLRNDVVSTWVSAAMSVLTKYVTAPVALLLALTQWRDHGARRAILITGICLVVAGIAYGPYLAGFNAGHFLRPYEHSSYQGSTMMLVEMVLVRVLGQENLPGTMVARLMLGVTLLAAGGLGLWYIRACLRVKTLTEVVNDGTRLLLYYLLFVTALLRISYLAWVVGLAALVVHVPLRRAVAIFSFTVLSLEAFWIYKMSLQAPDATYDIWRFAASAVAVGVPILYLLSHFRGFGGRGSEQAVAAAGEKV